MPTRLTGKEILAAIHEGNEARADKARALALELLGTDTITVAHIRQMNLLGHQLIPFLETVLRPHPSSTSGPFEEPSLAAAFAAFCVAVTTTVALLTVAAAGRLI